VTRSPWVETLYTYHTPKLKSRPRITSTMMTMIKTSVLTLLCASSVAAFAPHPLSGSAFVGGASKIASVLSQGASFSVARYNNDDDDSGAAENACLYDTLQ
jgi:hypothetical protein